jgi:hypothetical protein
VRGARTTHASCPHRPPIDPPMHRRSATRIRPRGRYRPARGTPPPVALILDLPADRVVVVDADAELDRLAWPVAGQFVTSSLTTKMRLSRCSAGKRFPSRERSSSRVVRAAPGPDPNSRLTSTTGAHTRIGRPATRASDPVLAARRSPESPQVVPLASPRPGAQRLPQRMAPPGPRT